MRKISKPAGIDEFEGFPESSWVGCVFGKPWTTCMPAKCHVLVKALSWWTRACKARNRERQLQAGPLGPQVSSKGCRLFAWLDHIFYNRFMTSCCTALRWLRCWTHLLATWITTLRWIHRQGTKMCHVGENWQSFGIFDMFWSVYDALPTRFGFVGQST